MAAKTKTEEKKETQKKRIKPVVEEVVEETPKESEEDTASSQNSDGVSVEPDFSSKDDSSESSEESTSDDNATEVEEETEEMPEETVDVPADAGETPAESVMDTDTVVEEKSETPQKTEVVEFAPSETLDTTGNKMSLKTVFIITLVSALVAAFVSGGVYVYLTGVNGKSDTSTTESTQTQQDTTEATPTPTAKVEESVSASDYSVQVLNGSGQIGAAGKGAEAVESAGFVVDDKGNAANYDFEKTMVQAKADVPQTLIDKLVKALEKTYTVETGDALKSSSEFDIVVTVGSN